MMLYGQVYGYTDDHAERTDLGHDGTGSSCLPTSGDEPDGSPHHANEVRSPKLLNSFTLWNCRGLKPRTVPSKVPYIQDLVRDKNQLFMALTETWLAGHTDAELSIDGYTLFRQDRKRQGSRRGRDSGGIAASLSWPLNCGKSPP